MAEAGSSGNPYMSFYMTSIDDELKTKLSSAGMAEECLEAGEALLRYCEENYSDVAYREGSEQNVVDQRQERSREHVSEALGELDQRFHGGVGARRADPGEPWDGRGAGCLKGDSQALEGACGLLRDLSGA